MVGERLYVAGYGVAVQGDGRSGGKLRGVYLAVTGKPGNLQIRLQDSDTKNSSPGAGACDGDSGAPAFDHNGDLIGIVSWTTAAGNNSGCGGLTGITPVRRYLPWVKQVLSQ